MTIKMQINLFLFYFWLKIAHFFNFYDLGAKKPISDVCCLWSDL